MAIRDAFKVSRKTFFNPRAWFNYDEFKAQNIVVWGVLRSIFVAPPVAPETETTDTFEEVMQRNGLTEADLAISLQNYRLFVWLFISLGLLAFIYAFFMLFAYHTLTGWILAMCVCGLLLAQAFKYDFWCLQLRRRRLNLTFADWKASILGGKGGAA